MKFYDTNALLELMDKAFEDEFYLSSKSIEELENIKVSQNKDTMLLRLQQALRQTIMK